MGSRENPTSRPDDGCRWCRALAANLPKSAVFVVDRDLRYLLAEGEALEEAGLKPDDLVGKTVFEALDPELAATYEPHYQEALRGEPFEHEHDAHGHRYRSRGVPLIDDDGRISRVLVTSYDITDQVRAEEALRQSEERFRAFVSATSDVVYRMDADWTRLRHLESGGDFLASRRNADESWTETYVPEEDRQQVSAAVAEAIRSREPFELEHRVLRADGSVGWVVSRAIPLLDESGEILEWFGAAADVTERVVAERRLRAAERSYRELVRNAPAGIYEIDFRRRRFNAVNEVMTELLGYSRDELLAMDPFELLDEQGRALFARRIAQVHAGQTPDRNPEFRVRTRDGRDLDVLLNVTYTFDENGNPAGATVVAHDITDRKRAEDELRRGRDQLEELARTLEERVRERTVDLERLALQLRQLHGELSRTEQRERKRLAVMLHDGLQQLLAGAKMRLSSARDEAGDARQATIAEVEGLLTEAIDASRSLSVELSPPVLHGRGLVAALRWLGRQLQQTQRFEVEVTTEEDAEPPTEDLQLLLFQATRELLFNVVKHAGVDRAQLRLGRENEHIVLEVIDEGRGFDWAHAQDEIAVGFGLFNIEQRLEWLGGRMSIVSEPGQGTAVRLRIPVGATDAAPGPPAAPSQVQPSGVSAAPRRSDHRRRVVLADDHQIVRGGIARLLEAYDDIDVAGEAADGEEAVELTRRCRPDVVVMDVTMPLLDGIEATRRITAEHPDVAVIGLSMHDSPELADAMHAAGAVGYVRKDGPIEELIALIRSTGSHR